MTFNELCEQHKLTHEERVLALAYLMALRTVWAFRALALPDALTPPA